MRRTLRSTPRTNRAGTRRQPVAGGNPPETRQTVHRLAALGYHWHNLMHLVGRVAPKVTADLCRHKEHLLLVHPGLIARYDQMAILETLPLSKADRRSR